MDVISSQRSLEITVLSGENVNITEEAYVVVRGESLNSYTTRKVKNTNCQNNNSTFLSWNDKFLLNLPVHARSITFEVQCNKFKGVRPVGVARIALSDILHGDGAVQDRVFSYRLRDWEGKLNGVIHFGVKKRVVQQQEEDQFFTSAVPSLSSQRFSGIDTNSKGVVPALPFSWNYQNIIV